MSDLSAETKCCIYAKVVRNAPEGILPTLDCLDYEEMIEKNMGLVARDIIDAVEVEEEGEEAIQDEA